MKHLVFRSSAIAVVWIFTVAISAWAGGDSKHCRQCGCEKHVKQICRLVKTCEEVDSPSYVYTKEEVFHPEKGAICYTGYRSDTFYSFWRTCDCSKIEDPSQQAAQHCVPQLHCDSYTVCGCKTLYGAKPTGCHVGCSIRVAGKSQRITTPILKWETVSLCKDCCEKNDPHR